MIKYKIYTLKEAFEWSKKLKSLPIDQQDIYFSPEYYSLNDSRGHGLAKCFCYEKDGNLALYPFIINSVNKLGYNLPKDYFDIQGAYGYNGVASNCYEKNFIIDFFNEFDNYCIKNNVIAEFVRFNPYLKNNSFVSNHNVILQNKNIILDLKCDDIWMKEYSKATRKNIKKAKRNNLYVQYFNGQDITKDMIKEFHSIYIETMERNLAAKFYYFDESFFQNLAKILREKCAFFFTLKDGIYISCELILYNSFLGYSFLGGTKNDYYEFRPNDILKHSIINYLKEIGLNYFCFGGGNKPDDGIFNYKKKFAKNGVYDFYIGKKIHNEVIYNDVIRQWNTRNIHLTNNKLLRYRDI